MHITALDKAYRLWRPFTPTHPCHHCHREDADGAAADAAARKRNRGPETAPPTSDGAGPSTRPAKRPALVVKATGRLDAATKQLLYGVVERLTDAAMSRNDPSNPDAMMVPLGDVAAELVTAGADVAMEVLRAHMEWLDEVTLSNRNAEERVPAVCFEKERDTVFKMM